MSEAALPKPGSLPAYVLGARPKTLPAAIAPVLVGSALAHAAGGFRLGPALAALLGALFLQIAANYANDLEDFLRGADDERRIGPLRVTQAGLLSSRQVRGAMIASFAAAFVCGLYLTALAGWPVVAIGLTSILAALAYTGGPFPLAYNGLGDLFVMLFFGLTAVAGTAYVQALHVPPAAWPAALATGALATAILAVNNVRDVDTDRVSGKRTLPVLFGRRAGVAEYWALVLGAHALPVFMVARGLAGWPALAAVATLPLGLVLGRRLTRERGGPELNEVLAGTAKLMALHALLFAAGIAAGAEL